MRLTPEQEAAYSLDYGVSRADLTPAVQAEYDRLLEARKAGRPAPVQAATQTRTYRPLSSSVAMAEVGALVFVMAGLGLIISGPGERNGAFSVIAGTVGLLGGLWLGAMMATNRLVVTATGLLYWNNLRRRFIGWSEIRSFGVGPSRSMGRYQCPIIYLTDGKISVTSLAAYTAKRATRIADELAGFQSCLATGQLPSDDATSTGKA